MDVDSSISAAKAVVLLQRGMNIGENKKIDVIERVNRIENVDGTRNSSRQRAFRPVWIRT